MNYLYYGKENYLIELEINKIIKKNKINELNVIKYNLEVDNIKEVIDECETISLFSDKKMVIVYNPFNNLEKNDEQLLLNYLNTLNDMTFLILVCKKLDERKKIVKSVKKKVVFKEFNNIDINNKIKEMFDDYKITERQINLLINRVGNDLELLNKEIEKIKLYKIKDKIINDEDIINLTHKNIDLDIFKLIDYIVKKEKEKGIELYYELIRNGSEPIALISLLSSQFLIMYQSKELIKKGYTEKDIASIIDVHPYRVKLGLQNSRNYDSKIILKYLYELSSLDIKIKTGEIDKNLCLELFILNL